MGNNNSLPNSWLFSENILKRSFAVLGHYLLGLLILWATVFVVAFAIGIILAIFSLI